MLFTVDKYNKQFSNKQIQLSSNYLVSVGMNSESQNAVYAYINKYNTKQYCSFITIQCNLVTQLTKEYQMIVLVLTAFRIWFKNMVQISYQMIVLYKEIV